MRQPWGLAVPLTLAALVAYSAATTRAQGEPYPFRVGEVAVFSFQGGGSRQCRIEDIKGAFARCGHPSDRQGSSIAKSVDRAEEWVNLGVVEWVTRPSEQR